MAIEDYVCCRGLSAKNEIGRKSPLDPPPEEPEKSWKDILSEIAYHIEEKERWGSWTPRLLKVDDDIPADTNPENLERGTPERALAEFLGYWKKSNYGYMAHFVPFLFKKYAEKPLPALVREAYEDKELISYRYKSCEHTVAAISEIEVSLELKAGDDLIQRDFTFRMICEDEQGNMVAHGNPNGKWVVMNWSAFSI